MKFRILIGKHAGVIRLAIGLATVLVFAGCVSIPADRSLQVRALVKARSNANPDAAANSATANDRVEWSWTVDRKRCTEPALTTLNADSAVSLALLCSPQMRHLYASLALTQAEVYQATRLSNPQFDIARLTTGAPANIVSTTWSVSAKFVEILLLPMKQRLGAERLLASQQRVAHEVLSLESNVRATFITYASARSIAELQARATTAAQLSARTAEAFHEAGNISELQWSRERATAVEAEVEAAQADIESHRRRTALLNSMGIAPSNPASLDVQSPLPLPPILRDDVELLRRVAREQRLDIEALKLEAAVAERMASQQGWFRWVGELGIGYEKERETGEANRSGPTASIGLPLFNTRKDTVLRTRGQGEEAQAALIAAEVKLDNEAFEAIQTAHALHKVSQSMRQQLVPLRERITALSQREFNYQFIGAFDLLAIKREELRAYRQYIEAIRDEWLAHVEVQRIAGGRLPAALLVSDSPGVAP